MNLVSIKNYTTIHGLPNLKICTGKQAKHIFHYKKVKINLYKNKCGHLIQQNVQN